MESNKVQTIKAVRKTQNGSVGQLTRGWQSWSEEHVDYQRRNPFSNTRPVTLRAERGDPHYGTPPEGSKTEQRGKDAHTHIGKELEELSFIIRSIGKRGQDGHVRVTFKELFDKYVTISNKVVGVLLRARKHGLVDFEGEMLWQGKWWCGHYLSQIRDTDLLILLHDTFWDQGWLGRTLRRKCYQMMTVSLLNTNQILLRLCCQHVCSS